MMVKERNRMQMPPLFLRLVLLTFSTLKMLWLLFREAVNGKRKFFLELFLFIECKYTLHIFFISNCFHLHFNIIQIMTATTSPYNKTLLSQRAYISWCLCLANDNLSGCSTPVAGSPEISKIRTKRTGYSTRSPRVDWWLEVALILQLFHISSSLSRQIDSLMVVFREKIWCQDCFSATSVSHLT